MAVMVDVMKLVFRCKHAFLRATAAIEEFLSLQGRRCTWEGLRSRQSLSGKLRKRSARGTEMSLAHLLMHRRLTTRPVVGRYDALY